MNSLEAGIIDYVLIELIFIPMYEAQAKAEDIHNFLLKMDFHLIDYYEVRRTEMTKNAMVWCTALFGKIKLH